MGVTGTNINLTLRSAKGSALTHIELDGNQSGLKTAIENHSHDDFSAASHNHTGVYAPALGADDNYVTDAEKTALHSHSNKSALDSVSGVNTGDQDLSGKQDVLVSGTNIKTINNQSLLGSGNLTIEGGSGSITLVFPFYKANGVLDTIQMTSGYELPFFKANGSADNIVMVTP